MRIVVPLRRLAMLGLMIALVFPASALIVRPLSLDELTRAAEWVVRGRVQSKSTQRDEAGRIYTEVMLDATEIWKGAIRTGAFRIVHSGGVLGEEHHVATGQVQFKLGEEVVVFAFPNARGDALVVAMAQGKFTILKGPDGDLLYVENSRFDTPAPSDKQRLKLAELKSKVIGVKP